ncbi:MAG TPA: hypothetical protein VFE05_10190 [Longimicrobiaceae bacterium]|jgi:hypothetical protein|nr:hypothetical protein [Longimicrobiaceae bacterium]
MSERIATRASAAAAILFLIVLAHAGPGAAQLVVQDARGRDIVLDYFNLNRQNPVRPTRSIITLNSGAEAVKVRLLIPTGTTDVQQFHSFDAQLQATDGVAEVFSGRKITGVQTFSYRYGLSHTPLTHATTAIDFLVLGLDYSTASFRLFDPSAAQGSQISSRDFRGTELSANYSLLLVGHYRLAFDGRYRRNNNGANLRQVDVEFRTAPTVSSPSGETQTVVVRKVSARQGTYQEWNSFPVGASLTIIPSEARADSLRIKPGISVYGYSELAQGRGSPVSVGANLTFTRQERKSGIRSTIGGIFTESSDLLDVGNRGNRIIDRLRFGIFLNVKVLDFSQPEKSTGPTAPATPPAPGQSAPVPPAPTSDSLDTPDVS